jgi:hypothetical protein
MEYGKQPKRILTACPCCARRIGLMTGLKAGTPFAIKCPHCKTTLLVRMRGLIPLVLAVIGFVSLCVWSVKPFFAAFGATWTAVYILLLLAVWLLLEVSIGVILFTHARFTPISRLRRDRQRKQSI